MCVLDNIIIEARKQRPCVGVRLAAKDDIAHAQHIENGRKPNIAIGEESYLRNEVLSERVTRTVFPGLGCPREKFDETRRIYSVVSADVPQPRHACQIGWQTAIANHTSRCRSRSRGLLQGGDSRIIQGRVAIRLSLLCEPN